MPLHGTSHLTHSTPMTTTCFIKIEQRLGMVRYAVHLTQSCFIMRATTLTVCVTPSFNPAHYLDGLASSEANCRDGYDSATSHIQLKSTARVATI
jgi:hypothetical protein